MLHKEYLLTPGPTQIPDRIYKAMEKPTIHHRTSAFKEHFRAAVDGFKWLVSAPTDPIFLACTGTGAMEAALRNITSQGESIIVLNGGKFGERWSDIGKVLGLKVSEIRCEWGETVSERAIEDILASAPSAKAFCMQYCETSTTVLHPMPQIVNLVKKIRPEILTVVDVVSCLATLPISMKEQKIDILVAASQKALMLPPGLAMVAISDLGWSVIEKTPRNSLYFDLLSERRAHSDDTTAWTPAISIILGLNEAIAMLKEEGLENVYKRHKLLSNASRRGMQALGFRMVADNTPSPSVTGGFPPSNLLGDDIRKILTKEYGVKLAGGQDSFKGKIIRIGHMGAVNSFDILTAITALENSLRKLGVKITIGTGTVAALEALSDEG